MKHNNEINAVPYAMPNAMPNPTLPNAPLPTTLGNPRQNF